MASTDIPARIEKIIAAYAAYPAETLPTRTQWNVLAGLPDAAPVRIVNFFKFRETADYGAEKPDGVTVPGTGQDAFGRYAAVSMPAMARAGGDFPLMGPFGGPFVGPDETWDMIVVGGYPDKSAILTLFEDAAYREAYAHRVAALADQRESFCL